MPSVGYLPLGYSSLDAFIGPFAVSGDEFGLGDIGIIPASFYWSSGNFHLNLYELVIAPTGLYDTANIVNVGRNYWSFDTVAAATWFNPESGTEVSIVPGIMVNTTNKATDYHTGTELHVDVMVNQFLSETFAVGVHGYVYKQIEGDSGSGAILGSFKGESAGLGLAASWIPASGGGNVAVSGIWLHDVTATNRLKADYGVLSVGISF